MGQGQGSDVCFQMVGKGKCDPGDHLLLGSASVMRGAPCGQRDGWGGLHVLPGSCQAACQDVRGGGRGRWQWKGTSLSGGEQRPVTRTGRVRTCGETRTAARTPCPIQGGRGWGVPGRALCSLGGGRSPALVALPVWLAPAQWRPAFLDLFVGDLQLRKASVLRMCWPLNLAGDAQVASGREVLASSHLER